MKKLLIQILNELKMINLQLKCIRRGYENDMTEKQKKEIHSRDYHLYKRATNGDVDALIEWINFKNREDLEKETLNKSDNSN